MKCFELARRKFANLTQTSAPLVCHLDPHQIENSLHDAVAKMKWKKDKKNIYNFAFHFEWRKLWCCCETFSEKSWQVSDMVMAAVLLVPIVSGQKNRLLSQYLNSLLSILSKMDIFWQLKASYCYCYQSQI